MSDHLTKESARLVTDAVRLLSGATITIRGAEAGGLQNRIEQLAFLAEQLDKGHFRLEEVEPEAGDVAAEATDGS